jgi:valyl-tRNA synthetase
MRGLCRRAALDEGGAAGVQKLYEKGSSPRMIVNWCPRCGASDEEVDTSRPARLFSAIDQDSDKTITVATTRPNHARRHRIAVSPKTGASLIG